MAPRRPVWSPAVSLAAFALLALGACGPSAPLPPDAGSIFGGGPDGSSSNNPDAGVGASDAAPADIDAGPLEPDAALGCDSDPEPDTESTAELYGQLSDCDDEGITVTGTLDGESDVDVFRIEYEDNFGCDVEPVATTRAPEICIFVDCQGIEVTCNEGVSQRSSSGLPGCCGKRLEFSPDCDGSDDSADFYLFARGAEAGQCVSYSISLRDV